MKRLRPSRARPRLNFLFLLLGTLLTLYPFTLTWVHLSGKLGGIAEDAPASPLYPYHHDGTLIWHRPKPDRVIPAGWEDEWMLRWKAEQFDPSASSPRCIMAGRDTPYDDGVLCEMPGYIPARLVGRSPRYQGRSSSPGSPERLAARCSRRSCHWSPSTRSTRW